MSADHHSGLTLLLRGPTRTVKEHLLSKPSKKPVAKESVEKFLGGRLVSQVKSREQKTYGVQGLVGTATVSAFLKLIGIFEHNSNHNPAE